MTSIQDLEKRIQELERENLLLKENQQQILDKANWHDKLLNATQKITKTGGWNFDIKKQTMLWTDEVYRIHGIEPQSIENGSASHIDKSIECYMPQDRAIILNAFNNCIQNGEKYQFDFEFIDFNKTLKWVQTGAFPVYTNNEITSVLGYITDITTEKQKQNELITAQLRTLENNSKINAILENTQHSIWAINNEYEIIYINNIFQNEFQQSFGIKLEAGMILPNALPEFLRQTWIQRYDRALNGEHFAFEDKIEVAANVFVYIEVSMHPIIAENKIIGASFFASNITNRKNAEILITQNLTRQTVLSEISQNFLSLENSEDKISATLETLGNITGVSRVYIFQDNPDELTSNNTFEFCADGISAQKDNLQNIPYEIIPSWKKILTEQGYLYTANIDNLPDDIIQVLKPQGIQSILVFPLYVQNKFFGFIGFDECRNQKNWEKEDIELLKTISGIISHFFERRILTNQLIESEKNYKSQFNLLQALIHYLPIPFFYKDKFGKYLGCNPAFENFTGNKMQDIKGKTVFDLAKTDIAKIYYEKDLELINNGISQTYEYIVTNAQNAERNVIFNKAVFLDELNKPNGIIGTFVDITDQKIIEQELHKAKEKAEESEKRHWELYQLVRNMADNMPDMLWAKNLNKEFIFTNKSICQNLLNAKDTNEPLGKTDMYFALRERTAHPENPQWHTFGEVCRDSDTITLQEMKPMQFDEYGNIFGKFVFLDVHKSPLYDNKGKLIGVVGSARDVTERKKIEIELISAKEKAEESDRLKTAFLQNMSHEIRTPMNAIMGFSSLLASNFGNKKKLEDYSKIIDLRCNDLLDIINDILDISKIESGQSLLNVENFNINELFNELVLFFNDYKVRIDKQDIRLLFCPVPDEKVAYIKSDKLKLKQIIINLVSNAFKFTETGTIECGYKQESNKLQFYVSDTGIGIPANQYDYIFERFTQLKHPSLRNIGGTGLGLPIVKSLVKLLGGNVWLESECNKGTTFYFTIDYFIADLVNVKQNVSQTKQEIVIDKAILIVEDDFYNAEYLKEVLKNISSNIMTVANGLAAVKIVQEQKIDIILMDIRLPDITGYEATKLILQDQPDIKIIAQTAYAASAEHQKAIDAGCIDYISKPTKQDLLLKIMHKYLKK